MRLPPKEQPICRIAKDAAVDPTCGLEKDGMQDTSGIIDAGQALSEENKPLPEVAPAEAVTKSSLEAIETRLAAMELHIDHLIRTAPTLPDPKQQEECWNYAREVQREIKAAREQLRLARERSEAKP